MDDGVFVALKPICDSMGLPWNRQRRRIQRDPILSEGGTMVVLPSPGGAQETLCLKLELINGWLFTIDESRVKEPSATSGRGSEAVPSGRCRRGH